MGRITLPEKAKLFIGILGIDQDIILQVKKKIEEIWLEIDLESDFIPFTQTHYYDQEMGNSIIRKFYAFKKLIPREEITDIKIRTNELETLIKADKERSGRDVNLDPGYLTMANITLATTKEYNHRIYLNKGIYLENTLSYSSKLKSYMPLEWTYPDYREQFYIDFFNKVRVMYKKQLRFGEDLAEER